METLWGGSFLHNLALPSGSVSHAVEPFLLLGDNWKHLETLLVVTNRGILQVWLLIEAKDSAKPPLMHRTAPHSKELSGSNANRSCVPRVALKPWPDGHKGFVTLKNVEKAE